MIISDKYKFIFLHVPKTGGSSISAFLNQFLGKNDLQLKWSDALIDRIPYNDRVYKELNNKQGYNLIIEAFKKRAVDKRILDKPVIELAFKNIISKKLGSNSIHAKAEHIKKYVKENKWKNYFKFCFIRNPYTHAVSSFLWDESRFQYNKYKETYLHKKDLTRRKFNLHLRKILKNNLIKTNDVSDRSFLFPGSQIYTIKNKIAVDYIGKFENLDKELKKISKIIGLPKPKFKIRHFNKKNDLSIDKIGFFDEENKKLVRKIWKKEFEIFDYKFPY